MNQSNVIIAMVGLLTMFSICVIVTKDPQASDTFGKLAFGALTALAAYLQHKDPS